MQMMAFISMTILVRRSFSLRKRKMDILFFFLLFIFESKMFFLRWYERAFFKKIPFWVTCILSPWYCLAKTTAVFAQEHPRQVNKEDWEEFDTLEVNHGVWGVLQIEAEYVLTDSLCEASEQYYNKTMEPIIYWIGIRAHFLCQIVSVRTRSSSATTHHKCI